MALPSGATAPSSANVKAGKNAAGTAVTLSGSFTNPTANTAATSTVSGLTASTTYDVYVVAEDGVPNLQASPVLVSVTTAAAPSATITTGAVTGAPVCATSAASITVAFTSTGTLTGTYTVQLSDAAGSFTSATDLTTTGTASPLTATIPAGTASGTGYKVRVVNSAPATTGSASAAFTIVSNTAITVAGTTPQTFNTNGSGTAVTASTASAVAPTYQWYYSPTANNNAGATLISGATSASYTPTAADLGAAAGTFYVSVRGTYPGCGDVVGTTEIQVDVTAAPATIALYSTAAFTSTAPATAPATTVAANATAADLSRGTVTAVGLAGVFGSSNFNTGTTLAGAITGNDYLAFNVAANTNYLANISSITLVARRTTAGPGTLELVYSTDASFTTYTSLGTVTTSTTNTPFTFTPGGSALQGVTGTTYFRLYGYNGGAGNLYVLDNGGNNAVAVFGTVTAAVAGTITVSTNGPLAVGTTTQATPSAPPVSYTVGGTSLGVSPLVVQAPAGFQVSLDAAFTGITTDANSLSLTPAAGTVPTTTIYVRLSGSGSAGALSGNITHSSGVSPMQSVAVTGTLNATPAEINLKQGSTSYASNGAAYTGFPTISVGAFVDQTFTIENLGGTPLTLGTFTATGDFELPNATPTSVAAFSTATFIVRFQPTAAGTRTGSVSIVNSDSDENPYVLNLSATATAAVPPITWVGTAGDNSFFTPANWSGNAVPGAADRVLLDHSIVAGAYTVTLDGGTTPTVAVQLISLTVNPGGGPAIELLLPATNTIQDGLTLSNTATGEAALAIYANGIVSNRSGSASASGIVINGSGSTFYIFNGGLYQHATPRSSSVVTDNLAGVSGTEAGTFVFSQAPSAPGGQVGISLQGRTFGNLTFELSDAAGYTSSGTTPTVINGNLTVATGTVFNNNLTSTTLRGNLVANGDISFGANNGQLILNGTSSQTISGTPITGNNSFLGNSLTVQINNPAGVLLQTSVKVPGTLQLTSGIVTTSVTNLLTLANNATGGSATSFVNGPLARVTGPVAATTVFPIGKGTAYRPLTLNAAAQTSTTTYTGEIFNTSARTSSLDGGLTRVSAIRYATLAPDVQPTGFSGTLTMAFGIDDFVNYPQDLSFVMAKRDGGNWQNIGRTSATGMDNGGLPVSGDLTSGIFTSFSDFSLASTAPASNNALNTSNPLPVQLTAFSALRQADNAVAVKWTTATEKNSARFEVQRSLGGREFSTIATVAANGNSSQPTIYAALDKTAPAATLYYRLRQVDRDGTFSFSPVATVAGTGVAGKVLLYPNPAHSLISFLTAERTPYRVLNQLGQPLLHGTTEAGTASITIETLPTGLYLLELQTATGRVVQKFEKE